MRLHFEYTAGDKVKLLFACRILNPHRSWLKLCDQRCVTRADTQFASNTGGKDHRNITGKNFLVCTYDVAANCFSHVLSLKSGCLSGLFLGHFRTLGHGFFNTADHVERLLGQVIVITVNNAFERADGVFQCHVLARRTGEGLCYEERL